MKLRRRRILSMALVAMMLLVFTAACTKVDTGKAGDNGGKDAPQEATRAKYETLKDGDTIHIGIVTGTVSQAEDEFRAAQEAIKKYGNADEGGMIRHDTYPDRFEAEQETTISKIVAMADDPDMRAVIVNQAVPGTSAAFQQIRAKRPDIILINLTAQEDTVMAENSSDLVLDADNVSRGYRVIKAAKDMGATKFAHITFPLCRCARTIRF